MKTDQIKDELQEKSDQIKVIRPTLRNSIQIYYTSGVNIFEILVTLPSYIFTTYSNSFQKEGVRLANKLTWENLKKQRRKP